MSFFEGGTLVSPDVVSLAELVQRAQSGDRAALEALCAECRPKVYRLALGLLGNEADACELTQDVLLQALRRLDQVHHPERLSGWLKTITRRMAITHLRRRQRTQMENGSVLAGHSSHAEDPAVVSMRAEGQQALRHALARLPSLDRETLTAYYLDSQTVRQMSEEFKVPEGTIKRRLHTARRRLAAMLQDVAV